ncbi:hypothetical protein GWK47_024905 [Chionoecetes opilio]|uniref:Uncharacterized protein n=1 Tax=Chionoecetes opilio TaxID=41210 RepID=A0A8J4XKQ4_CHIOP|nr:hypothetical protein GWK47_024905 [Chionoecetes opilio]
MEDQQSSMQEEKEDGELEEGELEEDEVEEPSQGKGVQGHGDMGVADKKVTAEDDFHTALEPDVREEGKRERRELHQHKMIVPTFDKNMEYDAMLQQAMLLRGRSPPPGMIPYGPPPGSFEDPGPPHPLYRGRPVSEVGRGGGPNRVEELEGPTKDTLSHIASYLARSLTRGNKCGACANLLVDSEAAPLDVHCH